MEIQKLWQSMVQDEASLFVKPLVMPHDISKIYIYYTKKNLFGAPMNRETEKQVDTPF